MGPIPRILIVERESGSMRKVECDLRDSGFEVRRVRQEDPQLSTGNLQLGSWKLEVPDLVLIEMKDLEPDTRNLEVESGKLEVADLVRAIKGAMGPPHWVWGPQDGVWGPPAFVPVLMFVGEDPASVVRGFDAGADDCIHRSYDREEMLARVRSMLRIKNLHDEIHSHSAELMELSTRDGLTGLYNRRYLFEQLAAEVERAVRYQQPLSCIMLDMDDFKPINDRYGHLVGDELFRQAAETFRSIPRRVDVIARYGGDEVAILLPATGTDPALSVAHRVCDTMAHKTFTVERLQIAMTVSLGVACLDPRNPITSDELVRRADVALYSSKRAGGNRVTVWSSDMEGESRSSP